jgi:hypothetical protein
MSQQLYAPIEVDKTAARRMVNPVTGNEYFLDARGGVNAQDVDVPWFRCQGFVSAGAGTTMYSPIEVARAASRPVVSPITGTTYFLDGRGSAAFAAADVGWAQAQGFISGV